jgi:hypothetical protein
MERKFEVKIGDCVAYSAKWLRNTGQVAGDIGHARGVVVALESPTPDWTLATIQWGNGEFPARVNVANLAIVGANSRFCAQ